MDKAMNGWCDVYTHDLPNGPIFHYTDAKGLMGILDSKAIWATNIFYLNDFSELVLAIKGVRDYIEGQRERVPKEDVGFLNELIKDLDEILPRFKVGLSDPSQTIYVCSFSLEPNQLSQWRAYSPEGNGYSIGFEFVEELYDKVINKQKLKLLRCRYTNGEHSEFQQSFLQHALGIFHEMQHRTNSNSANVEFYAALASRIDFLEFAPMLKHEKFSEEAEYRLIAGPLGIDQENIRFRAGKSVMVPYIEVKLAEVGAKLPYSKIVIGPTPYPELSEHAVRSLLLGKGYDLSTDLSGIPYRGGDLRI
jgi:Protein of unknown function (DUF2971)